jgi:peroxiredoxin
MKHLPLFVAAAMLGLAHICHAAPDTQPAADASDATALVGKPAPDFNLKTPDGVSHSLGEFKGHVVVLDFWATWCTACRVEQKHLTGIYDQLKAQGLVVFAIDANDNAALVPKFISDNNLTLPVLLDSADGKTGTVYKVDQMPETVIVGKDGIITAVFTEFAENKTPALMEKAIDAALAASAEGK